MSETALVLVRSQTEASPAYGRFDELRLAVLNGVTAENSKRNYVLALDDLSAFCRERQQPVSRTLILEFRAAMLDRDLSASTVNVKLSAVRKLVEEARRAYERLDNTLKGFHYIASAILITARLIGTAAQSA